MDALAQARDALLTRILDNVAAGRPSLDGLGDILGESKVSEWQSLSDWAMASLEEMRQQDHIVADALAPLMAASPRPIQRDLYIEGHYCGRTDEEYGVGMVAMMDSRPHPTEYRPNGTFVVTEVTSERVTMERQEEG